ncbi:unnamed protein product [Rhizopus stolonifer]
MPPSKPTEADMSCETCKYLNRMCNGKKPCLSCIEGSQVCVYNDLRVFGTNAARRLSSGSACETCRRRKTKCDGGSPCGFCASTGVECVNSGSAERKKRGTGENEAMERIEDRLRRIERLMTAFSPSTIKNCTTSTYYRKMSSPLLSSQKQTRAPRHHSIHGTGSSSGQETKNSPPLSPRQNMFLSPSSSSSTVTSTTPSPHMQSSISTPTSSNKSSWNHSTPIPSLMDQLSKLTFVTTMDYNAVQYPIYPIPSPPPSTEP